jgi:transposase
VYCGPPLAEGGVEAVGRAVIQPDERGRIMRCELTNAEWTAIKPMQAAWRATGERPSCPQRHLLGLATRCAVARSAACAFGPYTTCYNRLVRWRRAGVWSRIIEALAAAHDAAVQMTDTSIVRRASAWSMHQKEPTAADGRSRGGLTSKIHAVVDTNGM